MNHGKPADPAGGRSIGHRRRLCGSAPLPADPDANRSADHTVYSSGSIHLDQRVLLFSLAVAVFSVFLFGLIPAMQTTRVNLADAMKTGDAAASVKTRLWGAGF